MNPFVAKSTTSGGCQCSELQILEAIAQNIGNGFNILLNGSAYAAEVLTTRPANTTAYDALDVVGTAAGDALVFANMGPTGGGKVILTNLGLRIDASAIPAGMGNFRLHLYREVPSLIADGAAFNLPESDRAQYLGFIETPTPLDLGATLWSNSEDLGYPIRKEVWLTSSTIYGRLQTVNAYTPTSACVKRVSLAGIG